MNAAVADAFGTLQAALQLAEEWSLPVFPCGADKRPRTEHGFHNASMNIEQIASWNWTDALIGVPTGSASGLLVVDIDPAGADWYIEHAGDLAAGRVHHTRRGYHLLYRMPHAEIRNSAGRLATGVDTRASGGYIVWWPSHGLEASGGMEDIGEAPAWLLEKLTHVAPARGDVSDGGATVGAGSRNDFLSREAYRQRKQGSTSEQILEVLRALNRTRCAPPLLEAELQAIAAGKERVTPEALSDWPEPVNLFAELTAPSFTAAELAPVLAAYPQLYAEQTGVDPSIVLTAAVAAAAIAIPDQIQVCGNSASKWITQPRLWFLAIAPPGSMKTPGQKAMIAPLWDLHTEVNAAWAKAAADCGDDDDAPPRPRVLVADTTLEALSDVLVDNARGVGIVTDEFDAWLGAMDQYRSGGLGRDRGEWLQLFDGGPHSIERVKRGTVFVQNWGVSILTATTPAAMQRLTRHLPEDGLIQRFIPVLARRQQITVEQPERAELEAERERYSETIRRLYQLIPRAHNGVVPLSLDAGERFTAWRIENLLLQEALGTLDSALEAHVAKYPTLALRLALIFHCAGVVNLEEARGRDPAAFPIPLQTLETALAFLRRASQHALALYLSRKGGSEAYELARAIGRFLLARKAQEVQRRDLLQRVAPFRAAEEPLQAAALRLLEDLGWLRVMSSAYEKPQPTRYVVNPMLQERYAALAEREKQHRAIARERIAEAAEQRRQDRDQS